MSDKPEYNQAENGVAVKSKKKTVARHCKRFWWVYVILFIGFVVVAVPLTIFVIVPKIAQSKMNAAHLEIQGVNILQTESNAYHMEINSTIKTDGSIKANIDAFEGEMYLEDYEPHTAFATLLFPKTNANKHQVVNVSQEIKITDMTAFTRFNVWFHNNETVRITINGRTKVKPHGLDRKYGVTFKKTLTINGLNNFNGTEVTDGHISLENDDNGRNFNGTANIPNNSVFTLDIGNVSFTNFVGDENVGTLYIQDLLLKPGDNVLNITATMDQLAILSAVRKKPYCNTGILPFKLLGKSVVNNGDDLSYFAAALASTNQTVNIDIGSIIKNDLGTTVKCA
ncbi:hypothetical protein BGZ61DRAFT_7705 [Ilyonectria robusta]|uniref:uncharacterized protein n=1 Tax=Ilyonectria robusta TaxID=1079257 RepID=UPI001E8E94B9|nr:uncharacterized protein BGZ61DRAFT_7705 [Ilyonectria robusta]KAH8737037.1 hypothetical protein BGZ61DRAFT_7705 [Ilyonectria robusta]